MPNVVLPAPESIQTFTKIENFVLDESSYNINNLSMDCHTLVLTSIENNITRILYIPHQNQFYSTKKYLRFARVNYDCVKEQP